VAIDTKFADDKDVEGCAQGASYLVGHRHPSPGQRQDHDIIAISIVLEEAGKNTASIPPITKQAGALPSGVDREPSGMALKASSGIRQGVIICPGR
jgi:hypothetical protein